MNILQEWSGYIDDIDDGIVYLRLIDETDPTHPEDYGECPIEKLSHFGRWLKRGVHIRMYVVEGEEHVRLEWVEPTEEQIAKGRQQIEELLGYLEQLREDSDDD
jgi:hypothetical protein